MSYLLLFVVFWLLLDLASFVFIIAYAADETRPVNLSLYLECFTPGRDGILGVIACTGIFCLVGPIMALIMVCDLAKNWIAYLFRIQIGIVKSWARKLLTELLSSKLCAWIDDWLDWIARGIRRWKR